MKHIHRIMQSILRREREAVEKMEKDRAAHRRRKLEAAARKAAATSTRKASEKS